MKLVIDLQKESIEEISKCIKILEKVIENKKNNKDVSEGLEEFNVSKNKSSMNAPVSKMKKQEKLMGEIDLGKLLSKD